MDDDFREALHLLARVVVLWSPSRSPEGGFEEEKQLLTEIRLFLNEYLI